MHSTTSLICLRKAAGSLGLFFSGSCRKHNCSSDSIWLPNFPGWEMMHLEQKKKKEEKPDNVLYIYIRLLWFIGVGPGARKECWQLMFPQTTDAFEFVCVISCWLRNVSYHIRITCLWPWLSCKEAQGDVVGVAGDKAAKPVTTAQDCVSTFLNMKPLDTLKATWGWLTDIYGGGCSSGGRAGHLVIGRSLVESRCRSVLEQDTEPHIAPNEQLAPCMAASTISVGMQKNC